jgi:hypothetical protein
MTSITPIEPNICADSPDKLNTAMDAVEWFGLAINPKYAIMM